MKTTPKTKIEAFATGCVPATARISTWKNGPNEGPVGFGPGECASINVGRLTALGFEQTNNALEALATQLEAIAAKIRKAKVAS